MENTDSVPELAGMVDRDGLQKIKEEQRLSPNKPATAAPDKREHHLVAMHQGALTRPESKQARHQDTGLLAVPLGERHSAKKKFDQELQARDALLGIDDEEEDVAHHQDFSENEAESQMSGGD